MLELVLAALVFLATHLLPGIGPWRAALVARFGLRGYVMGYSALSIAVLIWLGAAYADAPYVELWGQPAWTRWVPNLAMPVAFVLLAAGLVVPNPLSLAARRKGFVPARPGLVGVTRHPVIWAMVLWAASHLFPNGDVASLILFGLLLLLALAGLPLLDLRAARRWGAEWPQMSRRTGNIPFAALIAGRAPFRFSLADLLAVALGLVLWIGFLHSHALLFGVSPLPF